MIADRDTGIEVQSTVTGERVQMGVRSEDLPHLMGVLTDLYSNKRLAVLREYSTNALDAHVEAGQTRPIEVTLPGLLAPFLIVRDYGTGLSVEDIHSIYSQYGRSTKRSTNDAVGMLGLGCKSALTYCSAFTVTSIKNGTKITVQISRDEDGSGAMTVVDTLATDESNGTTVTVPVSASDVIAFGEIAAEFFSYWKPGTVLVNSKQPAQFDGLKLSDDIYIVKGGSKIVMGNVAYPAPALEGALAPRVRVVAFVPIGAVNFPPSREALMDTANTRATIEKVRDRAVELAKGAIQREVNTAKTPADAVKVLVKWSEYLRTTGTAFTYKGKPIPSEFKMHTSDGDRQYVLASAHGGYQRPGASWTRHTVHQSEWPTTVWVTNFTPTKFVGQHKHKLLKWAREAGLMKENATQQEERQTVSQFVMLPGAMPRNDFIDPARIVDWEVARKIRLEPRVRANGVTRIPGSYDLYTEGGFQKGVTGDSIRQDVPIFYHHGNEYSGADWWANISHHYPKFTMVCLPGNRLEKFQRDVPKAKSEREAIKDKWDAWAAALTDDQKLALHLVDTGDRNTLCQIDAGQIDDPALREAVRIAKLPTEKLRKQRDSFRGSRAITPPKFTDPLYPYPLFNTHTLRANPDHVYAYLNWTYSQS